MKTLKQFISITERYYKPGEKLPSGRTPIKKATEKANTISNNVQRNRQQSRLGKVRRGSRNQYFDRSPSENKHIKITPGFGHTKISDTKNNIHFTVHHFGRNHHIVSFDHDNEHINSPNATNRDKMKFMKKVEHMYHHEVAHRYPHGHGVSNSPTENEGRTKKRKANTRSDLYSKKAGFGPYHKKDYDARGNQYKIAGNPPTPKQLASGTKKHRFTPATQKETDAISNRRLRY